MRSLLARFRRPVGVDVEPPEPVALRYRADGAVTAPAGFGGPVTQRPLEDLVADVTDEMLDALAARLAPRVAALVSAEPIAR